ncbi:UPF0481 protein At3g47200-like [Bidens hawaiensis]|uniref:UPF0481 protein At3g47200-like n=1 Tax=Bidens hawaiensis TaxID=980011 RepID=UPI00404ACE7A
MIAEAVKTVEEVPDDTMKYSPLCFSVPCWIYDQSPSSFTPEVIAIGPLHVKHECVQEAAGWKKANLHSLLSRIDAPKEDIVDSCMRKVNASLIKIRECYACARNPNPLDSIDDADLVDIMVMDACYILEFMLMLMLGERGKRVLFQRLKIHKTIMRDLLLVENQIPFFVLDDIFQCTVLKFMPDASLVELFWPILYTHNFVRANIKIKSSTTMYPEHILGLIHQCYMPQVDDSIAITSPSSRIESAAALGKEGLIFKPNNDTKWVMSMEVKLPYFGFWINKPTLEMPKLCVNNYTESVLSNLIAYEDAYNKADKKYITSYVHAMSMLMNTYEDVAILKASYVLVNFLCTNERVVEMIKKIDRSDVKSVYEEQWKKLNKYRSSWMGVFGL